MLPDTYKVEIIHFHNPHLMWIEVTTNEQFEELKFEQVGIYGILPLETTINFESNNLESNESEKWLPAAVTIIKQFLTESTEVWFTPTHIDRRVSIFDDNIHKYGEFILKKKNGKLKKLSRLLIKSGFAQSDEGLFHEKLISGKIVNRLENFEIHDVVSQLERYYKAKSLPKKYWERALKNQMSVFEFSQQLESALTESNLQKHNNLMLNEVLKNKMKDFEKCKDIEEDSLGRATRKIKERNKERPPCNVIQNKTYDVIQTYNYMKKFLDVNSKIDESMKIDKNRESYENLPDGTKNTLNAESLRDAIKQIESKTQSSKYSGDIDDEQGCRSTESCDYNDGVVREQTKKHRPTKIPNESFSENPIQGMMNTHRKLTEATGSTTATSSYKGVENNSCNKKNNKGDWEDHPNDMISISIKSNRLKKLNRNYNVIHEKRIAYGPPGLDKGKLKLDTAQVIEYVQIPAVPDKDKVEEEHCKIQLCEIDSELNIDVTNKFALKDILNKAEKKTSLVPKSPIENQKTEKDKENSSSSSSTLLQKKLKIYESIKHNNSFSSSDTSNKDSSINEDIKDFVPIKKCESEEDISAVINRLNNEYNFGKESVEESVNREIVGAKLKTNVNPFQNIDASISVFVDKLVKPILMVHSKLNSRIEPIHEMRDIPFNAHIKAVLKNMSIKRPMMLQTVSWFSILRGYSLFMISPKDSGKTLGYLPAVCRLVNDYSEEIVESGGPIAIVVCATVKSVAYIEMMAKVFLGAGERVVSCYAGIKRLDITTRLLNGCDMLITTPSLLVWLMQDTEFGVDLRRLCMFVVDDCERMSVVYRDELNISLYNIKEMLKKRAHKELKVQFILASRIWCSFMESLARKAPDTVICIGAFQECVLYSKVNTTVNFVKSENKISHVFEFLKQIDGSKRTVIVCRTDEEVESVSEALKLSNYTVFSCNNEMTVQDLHNINIAWIDYEEPLIGPILVCCDGNLTHMNVTNSHNLIHFSLPPMFSMFCKRFSVLIEHYPSMFNSDNETIKIKILLDDTNVEQMPKIINFIKRCTDNIPDVFEDICTRVLKEKDVVKAINYVPICNGMLSFGYCPDFYNCQERHAILKEYDTPQIWMPRNGLVTFTIIHCHTAAFYSARLKSHVVNGVTTEFRQTYRPLTIKLGLYYSKESNRKLHGIPQLGDICAVMIKQDLFMRCEVIKIITRYQRGTPNCVLVMLIDERKIETTRDICLFHLPDNLKQEETYAVQVRLASIQPKDKDITYSKLARDYVRKITESDNDIYIRGHICMTLKNCIFVDTMEVCHDLTSLNETVVRYNVRQELLENHAVTNSDHIPQLQQKCLESNFVLEDIQAKNKMINIRTPCKGTWAHLESDSDCSVFFASAISPDKFFVRLDKFESCMNDLIKDIQKYVGTVNPLSKVEVGEMVLAKFPDDSTYERARVDDINKDKIRCFFVDQGDWREVPSNHLLPITEKFVNKLPFQAIECRLVGIKPPGEDWTDFSINWLIDNSFDRSGNIKHLFVRYFTKEPAEFTGEHKYGVTLTDTNGDQDVIINQLMMDLNLAGEVEEELKYLNSFEQAHDLNTVASSGDEEWEKVTTNTVRSEETRTVPPNTFFQQPIRSVPLIDSDEDTDDLDKWQINMSEDFKAMFKPVDKNNLQQYPKLLGLQANESSNTPEQNCESIATTTESKAKNESDVSGVDSNDFLIVPEREIPKIKEIDSDDLTSPESTKVSIAIDNKIVQQKRRPKLLWRQNKKDVIVKIQLIGAEYSLNIEERTLIFSANANETEYAFELELYGVVEKSKCSHENKGQYILVRLVKVINKNWLTLTRDGGIQKWIVYDVDNIDTSSDEEEIDKKTLEHIVKNSYKDVSESEDEDFYDDVNVTYK